MKDTKHFEKFLNSAYGQRVLERFNKEKRFIENPADLIAKKCRGRKIVDYLDIGGGTGVRTLKIMKALGIKSADFLEPADKAAFSFMESAAKSGISVNVIHSSFENFNSFKKYDFVTSVHSWYYIDLGALAKLRGLLSGNGRACIFLDTKEDTIKKMQNICERDFLGYESNNAEDVCRRLDELGISYRIFKDNKKFSGLLKGGKFTMRGKTIMSLISYSRWSEIPNSTKESVAEMLRKISKKDIYPSKRWLIVIKK